MYANKTLWRFFFLLILGLIAQFAKAQADYYWVGGSGNWSDLNHWVTVSGGSISHTILPSTRDNVFFDENSFSVENETVFMDVEDISVHDSEEGWL